MNLTCTGVFLTRRRNTLVMASKLSTAADGKRHLAIPNGKYSVGVTDFVVKATNLLVRYLHKPIL